MYFYLIGLDHKITPLEIRENLYRQRREILGFWGQKSAQVLFTCNRIEIYGLAGYSQEALNIIADFSKKFPEFARCAYFFHAEAAIFRRALRLAVGLESQIQGEAQILAQINNWLQKQEMPYALSELWKKVIPLAEEIRLKSGLYDGNGNIAKVIFADIKSRFSCSRQINIIVLGTGKIAELLARFYPEEAKLNFIAHRNYQKARELAKIAGGKAIFLRDLSSNLCEADVLISATLSPHYILQKEHFSRIRSKLYVYDLALPRDVNPQVRELSNVFLQDLDDLAGVISRLNLQNQPKINLAARLVEQAQLDFSGTKQCVK